MKYLKRFNESNIDLSEFNQMVSDLTIDLSDRDYNIRIFPDNFVQNGVFPRIITIDRVPINWVVFSRGRIKKLWNNQEEKREFMSDIGGLLSYLESEGFETECKVTVSFLNQTYQISLNR
jgi:hypothetical protein